ncbi:MAG: hypothetical protein IKP69_03795 [Oscillospiraceae bacterium]|nr:hypothetical protein [Oscillospiraceae bacterium]
MKNKPTKNRLGKSTTGMIGAELPVIPSNKKKLFNRQNGIYLISFRSAGFLRLQDVHDVLSICVVDASGHGTS